MMKEHLSTCLLFALLSPVTSLTCSNCRLPRGYDACDVVKYPHRVCRSYGICSSGVLQSNIVQWYQKETYRQCEDPSFCHSGDYSVTAAEGKFLWTKVICCRTELCNLEPPHLPPREDLPPNGLQCPACYSMVITRAPQNCQSQGNVSCLAYETKCIDYFSILMIHHDIFDLKFQGCASEDMCALDGKHFSLGYIALINVKAKCYDPEKSSRQIDLKG
ncbi:phospholipase A2 inhibitor NAI-like [Podarcis raffonei]|uniref:phospholipase A2 inhibitor NAI-like n=1 Tax=Podarcis raffonei TaxID=65483 RepID=UPI0023290E89|nr:phospholipase A2 inhibitor NAI-like [Podarcis raffonei]